MTTECVKRNYLACFDIMEFSDNFWLANLRKKLNIRELYKNVDPEIMSIFWSPPLVFHTHKLVSGRFMKAMYKIKHLTGWKRTKNIRQLYTKITYFAFLNYFLCC